MAKYEVTLSVSGQETFLVDADTESSAIAGAAEKYEAMYHKPGYRLGSDFNVSIVKSEKLPDSVKTAFGVSI